MTNRPDWLVPGTKVATFNHWQTMGVARPVFTTIERVLKRDVVLADGQRFNAETRQRSVGGGGFGGTTYYLYPADAPEVKKQVQKYNAQQVKQRAKNAGQDYWQGKIDAQAAIIAIAGMLDDSEKRDAIVDILR